MITTPNLSVKPDQAHGDATTTKLDGGLAMLTFHFPYRELHHPYESSTFVGVATGFNAKGWEVASARVSIFWNFPLGGFEPGPVPIT